MHLLRVGRELAVLLEGLPTALSIAHKRTSPTVHTGVTKGVVWCLRLLPTHVAHTLPIHRRPVTTQAVKCRRVEGLATHTTLPTLIVTCGIGQRGHRWGLGWVGVGEEEERLTD